MSLREFAVALGVGLLLAVALTLLGYLFTVTGLFTSPTVLHGR